MPATPRPRSLAFELAVVVLVSAAVLVPGIWGYSLVDPWETHYGEVSRMMLQDHDLVHLEWPGTTNGDHNDNEGFRSKPVLQFWMMAASMRAVGLAADGGYSGEMVKDARTMVAVRLPFVLSAIFGLVLMWWMLARLVSRRLAWLALLVVGSTPFFCLVSRQAIPDMPLVATVMGALALFTLAMEDGERPVTRLGSFRIGNHIFEIDARHVMLGLTAGFVVWQALYYAIYFTLSPGLAIRGKIPPAIWLPGIMLLMLLPLWSGWMTALLRVLNVNPGGGGAGEAVYKLIGLRPLTTMRQLFLLGCYSLLGIGVLAKGPPGLAVVGGVGVLYIVLCNKWRALYDGAFELKRGTCLMLATFLPWHLAMYLKDGIRFIDEYIMMHILDRAAVGVDNSPGTFEYYTSQLGHGMWLWAALVPAALAAAFVRARQDTREGRVRFMMCLWAIVGVAFFSLVQTKFHHYILPVVPALGILVAFFLDDILAGEARFHPIYAALGIGIVLLVARDLMWEPERWIEMFVYRYDRPWPSNEPWLVDPSDGFLVLGIAASCALALLATRWRRLGVAAVGAVGLAICVWSLQAYMPDAGTHWGMREAVRTYYQQRSIYGEKLAYFGYGEVYDDWHGVGDTWKFDSFIPDALQVKQPMTLTVEVHKAEDERIVEQTIEMVGEVSAIGDHTIEIKLPAAERKKLDPLIARGEKGGRGRQPVRAVDADRLLAWQLYWRGENFWSTEEIWGYLNEMKTSFPNPNNTEFTKYLGDRARAPLGRRYFILTETGRITTPRGMLPTQRGRDSYEVLDTTSNKFAIAAFYM
jgi:4-amino-4-deoxy-L-arabinose transferase-like glycosyltransferase